MGIRKNYECERDRWIGLWKKDPKNDCISQKDMKHNAAVQTLSSQMQGMYGVSLRLVSSQAIRPYMDLDEKTPETRAFKQKVFAMIIQAIKNDCDPFTGEIWGDDHEYGLTRPVVCDIIRFVRHGTKPSLKPKHTKMVKLSQSEIELLDSMRICVLSKCKSNDEKDKIVALYKKIRGI